MRRLSWSLCALALVINGCVIQENPGDSPAHGCGPTHQSLDGEACYCDGDCLTAEGGSVCLDEASYGWPRGLCAHLCKSDTDCNAGFLCADGLCQSRCTSTQDCRTGRMCLSRSTDLALSCYTYCDQDTDCEVGRCNLYRGTCSTKNAQPASKGIAALCSGDDDCASNVCSEQACLSMCDPAFQRCPQPTVCKTVPDGSSACLWRCTGDADCATYGMPKCRGFGDGEQYCYFPTQ
jgi:hypothetical protein